MGTDGELTRRFAGRRELPGWSHRWPAGYALAPLDWQGAMHAEARSYEFHPAGRPHVRVAFPGMPGRACHAHHFAWDYAATHRLQALPTGATLLMLNDRCAIVFAPFPIVGCLLGTVNTKGDLFRHMNDARDQGTGSLP